MTDDSLYERLTRVDSAERVDLFAEWWERGEEEVPIAVFYKALRLVWSSAEFLYRYDEVWDDLWWLESLQFERDPARRCELMTPEEMRRCRRA